MATINRVPHKKPILLIGDIIFDIHHHGMDGGISIEAPVSVGLHVSTVTSWGGAGLVARNLLALKVPVLFFSVVGEDIYGRELLVLDNKRLTKKFFTDKSRHTIVKERFLIKDKKALRWNRGDSRAISSVLQRKLLNEISKVLPNVHSVFMSDYRHGLMTNWLAQKILKLAPNMGKKVWVDSQVTREKSNHHWYHGADLICLNQKEAKAVDSQFKKNDLKNSLKRLQKILNSNNIIIKLRDRGSASLLDKDYILTSAHKVKAIDNVGAGDSFFAALASRGELTKNSLSYANRWASLATTVSGTEPPKLSMRKTI